MSLLARLASCVIALASLTSCSSASRESQAPRIGAGGLVAQLRSPNSAVTGSVRVNLYPGQYRIALHETPNCRSPNLFSAGPPWAPPGSTKPAGDFLPGFLANAEGSQTGYVAYVPGLYTERPPSLRGRSVVIHWGTSVNEAFPGQPNNRVACGVFEWTDSVL